MLHSVLFSCCCHLIPLRLLPCLAKSVSPRFTYIKCKTNLKMLSANKASSSVTSFKPVAIAFNEMHFEVVLVAVVVSTLTRKNERESMKFSSNKHLIFPQFVGITVVSHCDWRCRHDCHQWARSALQTPSQSHV